MNVEYNHKINLAEDGELSMGLNRSNRQRPEQLKKIAHQTSCKKKKTSDRRRDRPTNTDLSLVQVKTPCHRAGRSLLVGMFHGYETWPFENRK